MEQNTLVRDYIEDLASHIRLHETQIEGWMLRMKQSPTEALDWATPVYFATARLEVKRSVHRLLTESTLQRAHYYAMDRVVTMASYPESSTSATANLLERYRLAAWAEQLNRLADIVAHVGEGV